PAGHTSLRTMSMRSTSGSSTPARRLCRYSPTKTTVTANLPPPIRKAISGRSATTGVHHDNRDAEPECVGPCGDGQRCREPRRSEPVSSSYCTSSSSSDRLVLLRFFRRSESAVQFRWLYFRMERSELRTLCSLRTSEISVVSWVAVFFD